MTEELAFPEGVVVLDASALINILGTEYAVDVVRDLGATCYIEERTKAEVTRHPVPSRSLDGDLAALMAAGLQLHRMSDSEYDEYLRLVGASPGDALGTGESAAIAASVGIPAAVVLDDRKARRVFQRDFPGRPFATTLSLLLCSARKGRWDADKRRLVLHNAVANANMAVLAAERGHFEQAVMT